VSEYKIIRTENELAEEFLGRLKCREFSWAATHHATVTFEPQTRRLQLELDGRVEIFTVECRLNLGRREIEQAASKAACRLLLITVRLSQAVIRHCRELGVSCADLNGRAWIRAEGLLIDYTSAPPVGGSEYTTEEKEPDLFSQKSSRLPRVLLSFPDRTWKQSDLVHTTVLATGLVSRLLNYLVRIGWVEGGRGGWRLKDASALLDAWVQEDNWSKRVTLRQYSTLERDLGVLARRLTEDTGHTVAFTQWFAAGLRFPYADVPVLSVYRDVLPDAEELTTLGLTEVNSGGRIWFILPRDPGVFQVGRRVEGLPLVSDVQTYLDLLQVGLRGPDQAKALREWSGFCR